MQNIQLQNSIENLGESCFFYSTVEKIKLSSNIKTIPDSCFCYCNDLKGISPLNQIERTAFANCKNLKSIQFYNIKEIEEYAFLDCESLKKIEISNNIRKIELNVFRGCDNLQLENFENENIKIKNNNTYQKEISQKNKVKCCLTGINQKENTLIFKKDDTLNTIKNNLTIKQIINIYIIKI